MNQNQCWDLLRTTRIRIHRKGLSTRTLDLSYKCRSSLGQLRDFSSHLLTALSGKAGRKSILVPPFSNTVRIALVLWHHNYGLCTRYCHNWFPCHSQNESFTSGCPSNKLPPSHPSMDPSYESTRRRFIVSSPIVLPARGAEDRFHARNG